MFYLFINIFFAYIQKYKYYVNINSSKGKSVYLKPILHRVDVEYNFNNYDKEIQF